MADDDDARDERLGRLLEVEPLDEVARPSAGQHRDARRTAAPAATRSGGGRGPVRRRRLGRGDPGGGDRLPRAPRRRRHRTERASSGVRRPPPAGRGQLRPGGADHAGDSARPRLRRRLRVGRSPKAASAGPRGLGDVGNLEVAANLDRLRASITGEAFSAAAGEPGRRATPRHSSGGCGRSSARPSSPQGTIVAIGTGRFGTRDAIVVATTGADGTTSLDAVVTHPCEVRPLD